jgi:hypothetical protein
MSVFIYACIRLAVSGSARADRAAEANSAGVGPERIGAFTGGEGIGDIPRSGGRLR